MAHISSDGDSLLALSVGNLLHVINSFSNVSVLKHFNELANGTDSNDSNFITHTFSPNKQNLAAITGDKKLLVWSVTEKTLTFTLELPKRPTCLCFCNKEDTVIVGDKSGDVYRYVLGDENVKPHLLLGHLSMVLDVAIAYDDTFIISADRDEKIRISSYPNSYSIHNYCLGHTQLVSSITLISNDFLVSGSGDKTLRLWNYKDGNEVNCFDLNDKVNQGTFVVSKVVYCQDVIAVIGEGSNVVMFFNCKENTLTFKDSYHLCQQPFDICFQNEKAFILVRDPTNQIIVLEKINDVFVEKNISFSNVLQDDRLSTASLSDLKYLTELIKPPSKKRINEDITPESTINYVFTPKVMRIEA